MAFLNTHIFTNNYSNMLPHLILSILSFVTCLACICHYRFTNFKESSHVNSLVFCIYLIYKCDVLFIIIRIDFVEITSQIRHLPKQNLHYDHFIKVFLTLKIIDK